MLTGVWEGMREKELSRDWTRNASKYWGLNIVTSSLYYVADSDPIDIGGGGGKAVYE